MRKTPNDRIVDSAYAALRGDIPNLPNEHGACLMFVRLVVEHAFSLASHEWYQHWRTHPVERKPGSTRAPWARDMERSLREQGMAVSTPRSGPDGDPTRYAVLNENVLPGDLLFRWNVAANDFGDYIGHVGIFMPGRLVLESVTPAWRPRALVRGATCLGDARSWPTTTVIRFDPYRNA